MNLQAEIDKIVLDIRKAESGMRDAGAQAQRNIIEHHLEKIEQAKTQLLQLFDKTIREEVIGQNDDWNGIVKASEARVIIRNNLRLELRRKWNKIKSGGLDE